MFAIEPRSRVANSRAGPARGFAPWLCAALVALMAVGAAVVDDYDRSWDETTVRHIALGNWDIVRGVPDARELKWAFTHEIPFYGVAFEMPLLLLEYGMERLGFRTDHRLLARHFVAHVFFLLGGCCCALLAHRMFHSRALALLALALFAAHPRLYAASFYNTKDIPFLDVFMIALYLTHRALRRDTVVAYALCGACVGVLINLRIQGWVLFVAVAGLRVFDLAHGRAGRPGHVLATLGAFALAGLGTLYAVFPSLWSRPLAYAQAFPLLSNHPTVVDELFQGVQVLSNDLPTLFLPIWMAISTPPATLLLGALGAVAVCVQLVRCPSGALANVELRFLVLALGVLAASVGAVIAFDPTMYDGWRHMFFLHAPLSVLAVFALRTIARNSPPRLSRAAQAATLAAALATCAEMARAHPHQYAWFNFLVDRKTPEALRSRYEMDHRGNACWEGLRHLANHYPRTAWVLEDGAYVRGLWLLPPAQRNGFRLVRPGAGANVVIRCGELLTRKPRKQERRGKPHDPKDVICSRKVHNSTVLEVIALH